MTDDRWTTWHLHLATGAVPALDRVVLDVAAPAARATSRPWFFLRYWQGGPHVRLRVADLDGRSRSVCERRLAGLLAEHGAPRPGEERVDPSAYRAEAERQARGETGADRVVDGLREPGVHRTTYEPELERYGGAPVMRASEHLFGVSSALVVRLLPALGDLAARRRAALRLTEATARSLGPGPARAVFHEIGRRSWSAWARSYGHAPADVARVGTVAADAAPPASAFAGLPGWLEGWTDEVGALVGTLRAAGVEVPGRVLASHVHMTHNRLGLGILDELRTYAVLAATFPAAPEDVPDLGLPATA